jgi:uncharacterized SAM-binding protein YcdF (DUF218 family)
MTIIVTLVLELTGFHQYALYIYRAQNLKVAVDDKDIDMVVVLAGSMGRIETAYELMNNKNIPILFISGANSKVGYDALAKRHLWDPSSSHKIKIDNVSTTTLDNAKLTREFALSNGVDNIVLVTSIYHLQRSLLSFNKVFKNDKVNIIPYGTYIKPLEFNSWWNDYDVFKSIFTEYFKYQFYKLILSSQ